MLCLATGGDASIKNDLGFGLRRHNELDMLVHDKLNMLFYSGMLFSHRMEVTVPKVHPGRATHVRGARS